MSFYCFANGMHWSAILVVLLPTQVLEIAGDATKTDDTAKDMGAWNIAFTMPQIIASAIAVRLLDAFQNIGARAGLLTLAQTVIFSLAVAYFALGTYFVHKIKSVR